MENNKRDFKEVFHKRLDKLIEDNPYISQKDLANEIGVTQQRVNQYLSGSMPGIDKLIKIAEFFHVSTDYLLGVSDVNAKDPTIVNVGEYLSISGDSVKALKKAIAEYKEKNSNHDIDDIYKNSILDSIFQSDFLLVLTEATEDQIALRDLNKILSKLKEDFLSGKFAQKRASEDVEDTIAYFEYYSNRNYRKLISSLSEEIGSFFSFEDDNDIVEASSLEDLADIINAKGNKILNNVIDYNSLFPYPLIRDYEYEDLPPAYKQTDDINRFVDEQMTEEEFAEADDKLIDLINSHGDERMDSEDE